MPIQPRPPSARVSSGDQPHAEPQLSQRGVKSCAARKSRTSPRSAGAEAGRAAVGRSSARVTLGIVARMAANDVSVTLGDDLVATVEVHRPPANYFDADMIGAIADAYEALD